MTENEYSFQSVEFDPFAGPEIEKIVPAIEPQVEIWAACMVGGEDANRSYNESVSLELTGNLDRSALEKALKFIIQRHEALRSGITSNGEQFCVFKTGILESSYRDISTQASDLQTNIIANFLIEDATKSFNVQTGPLFRINLFKQQAQLYHLTLSAHHIICDGWSIGVIMLELAKVYSSFVENKIPVLEPAPSFADYAIQQKHFYKSAEYQKIEDYWLNQFKDDIPILDIPTDHVRPEVRTYKSRRDDYKLDPNLVDAIRRTGSHAGCSFVTTMIVAFEVFLHKISGKTDIVLGIPSAGQAADDVYGLVGHCVNMLPVRSRHNAESTFIDYLKGRKAGIFDAYENQQFTFGTLLKKMGVSRDPSRVPLIPIVFNIDIGLDDGVKFKDIEHKLHINKREFENFEIFLNASGSGDSLTLEWSYNTHLFDKETIERMMGDFESLLKVVSENPEVKISQIRMAASEKVKEFIGLLNNKEALYPREASLHSLFEQKAVEHPEKRAFSFNSVHYTYYQLNAQANQLSMLLLEHGIQKGETIALVVDRSAEMLIALLAILKCGAAYVPIDPSYPQKSIEYMLSDSSARILITQESYRAKFSSVTKEIVLEDVKTKLSRYPDTNPDVEVSGSDLAYVIYTSGSSGKPKGTLLEHHNVVNFLYSMQKEPGIKGNDRLLAVTTISFDIAGLELYLPLISGAELVIADKETVKDGRLLLDFIKSHKITMMQATPSTWKMMIDAGWDTQSDIKALCGGEALSSDLANKLLHLSREVWNMYGPTETTIWSSIKKITRKDELITIGSAIDNTRIYILNDQLEPVMPGLEGQIFIAGDGVARGYLNQPELTASHFLTDPFSENKQDKIYRTGDLGKFTSSGEIVYLGRIDNQIKIRGHRVELSAIEYFLNKQEAIKEAVVIPREDVEDDKRLVAYIVPKDIQFKSSHPTWQERWEDLYQRGAQAERSLPIPEQQLDIAVAQQISGRTDIKVEVEEWLKQSVERIKRLKSKNTMELGCGAGQLVFELAPFTEYFLATDYSETAISKLKEKLESDPEKFKNVKALTATADDLRSVEAKSLDLVIINGVAQYFPDADYLLKVISEASKSIQDGGCIYIGDMQGKKTLNMYHAFDQLNRTDEELTSLEFQKIVERRVRLEDELVADPAFFYMLPKTIPAITAVNIQLREGNHLNETTKYHYDIWLYVNSEPMYSEADVTILWSPEKTIEIISEYLDKNRSQVVLVSAIFNERTALDFRLQEALKESDQSTTVKELKNALQQVKSGENPQYFWDLGRSKGMITHIRWTTDGSDGLFDAIFIPEQQGDKIPKPLGLTNTQDGLYEYSRNPLSKDHSFTTELVSEWKQVLKDVLPIYMIPSEFVMLTKMPLLPNGKIDTKKLPRPEEKQYTDDVGNAPATDVEKLVAKIWREVLGLNTLRLDDDFFELGGHSLLGVQVMIRMEKETGERLPLTTLFKFSTLEEFAGVFSKA